MIQIYFYRTNNLKNVIEQIVQVKYDVCMVNV